MLPIRTARIGDLAHSGIIDSHVLSAVECQLIGSALRSGRFPAFDASMASASRQRFRPRDIPR